MSRWGRDVTRDSLNQTSEFFSVNTNDEVTLRTTRTNPKNKLRNEGKELRGLRWSPSTVTVTPGTPTPKDERIPAAQGWEGFIPWSGRYLCFGVHGKDGLMVDSGWAATPASKLGPVPRFGDSMWN